MELEGSVVLSCSIQAASDPGDDIFLQCADDARRLPDHRQFAPLSQILEGEQGHRFAGIHYPHSSSLDCYNALDLADFRTSASAPALIGNLSSWM